MSKPPSQENTSFLECHLKYLMEDARYTPKLQLERALGPLLTHFIARAMSGLTLNSSNSDLAGQYQLVCSEFSLKRENDNRSTNVDWLLFNETTSEWIFLELKTDVTSIRDKQIVGYAPYMSGTTDFAQALADISKNTRHKQKYEFQLRKLNSLLEEKQHPKTFKLVYLAPGSATVDEPSAMRGQFRRITFADLPERVEGDFASEWTLIRQYIQCLDQPPKLPDAARN